MTKEDWIRCLIHLPWGILGAFPLSWWMFAPNHFWTVVLLILGIAASFTATWLMIAYEFANDWRKKDLSYRDILGIVWGYLIGIIIIGVIFIIGVGVGF